MIKKIIVLSIIAFWIISCSVTRHKYNDDYIVVYKSERIGEIMPGYITLKRLLNSYDMYNPGSFMGETGRYEIKGDTLRLFPRYEYYESQYPIKELDSLSASPTNFLIKGKELIIIRDSIFDSYYRPRIKLW